MQHSLFLKQQKEKKKMSIIGSEGIIENILIALVKNIRKEGTNDKADTTVGEVLKTLWPWYFRHIVKGTEYTPKQREGNDGIHEVFLTNARGEKVSVRGLPSSILYDGSQNVFQDGAIAFIVKQIEWAHAEDPYFPLRITTYEKDAERPSDLGYEKKPLVVVEYQDNPRYFGIGKRPNLVIYSEEKVLEERFFNQEKDKAKINYYEHGKLVREKFQNNGITKDFSIISIEGYKGDSDIGADYEAFTHFSNLETRPMSVMGKIPFLGSKDGFKTITYSRETSYKLFDEKEACLPPREIGRYYQKKQETPPNERNNVFPPYDVWTNEECTKVEDASRPYQTRYKNGKVMEERFVRMVEDKSKFRDSWQYTEQKRRSEVFIKLYENGVHRKTLFTGSTEVTELGPKRVLEEITPFDPKSFFGQDDSDDAVTDDEDEWPESAEGDTSGFKKPERPSTKRRAEGPAGAGPPLSRHRTAAAARLLQRHSGDVEAAAQMLSQMYLN